MQAFPTPTGTTVGSVRKWNRVPVSCTQCRKRKQKCNRDRPCNHCSRRYPPPTCIYENVEPGESHQGEIGVVARVDNKLNEPARHHLPQRFQEHEQSLSIPANHYTDIPTTPLPLHVWPLTQKKKIFPRKESRTGARQLCRQGKTRNYTTEEGQVSDYVRFCWNPYLLSRRGLASAYGCPEAFDGYLPIIVQPLPPIPIDNTGRNAELFHFFHYVLAPYIGAVDTFDQPKLIRDVYRPWIASSTFMAYPAILSSSYFQAEARGLDVSTHAEAIAIKVKIISIINEYIKTNRGTISDEVIATVNHILINEWYYGDKKSQLAHMKGLQQMLSVRGGLENMRQNAALYALLVITDYQIACTCERELSLHKDTHFNPLPVLASYPVVMESPLLQSNIRFGDIYETLGISKATADILDNMRFLTCSVVALATNEANATETIKCLTTARWIHDRVSALPSIKDDTSPLAGDFIYECCRIAAVVYSSAILNHVPLSKACSMLEQQMFWANMPRIPLPKWKSVSGIYLWLCLVFCPAAEFTVYGRFLKSMASTTLTYVGLTDWEVMMGCLKGFLRVQRWLRREGEMKRICR